MKKFVRMINNNLKKSDSKKRIFIIGDLNVDNIVENISLGQNIPVQSRHQVGGTGYNVCLPFKKAGFHPILFGKIGRDYYGELVRSKIENNGINSLVKIHNTKPTGLCNIVYFREGDQYRTIFYDPENANDYDVEYLDYAIKLSKLNENDYVFISLYLFPQVKFNKEHCKRFFKIIKSTDAKIILDLTPHQLYSFISLDYLNECVDSRAYAIIGEFHTFINLIYQKRVDLKSTPKNDDYKIIAEHFFSKFFICRFGGGGNISNQSIFYKNRDNKIIFIEKYKDTGFDQIPQSRKSGFGDILTAKDIEKIIDYEKFCTI